MRRSLGLPLLLLLVQPARAVEPRFTPKPAWEVPAAVSRLSVRKAGDDFMVVELPAMADGKPVAAVQAFSSTNELPARVLWAAPEKLSVLVDARAAAPAKSVRVYPVPGAVRVAAGAGSAADPLPIHGSAARTAGMDFPSTLPQLRQLATRFDTREIPFASATFDGLKATFKQWYRGDWTRKSHLVRLNFRILVPTNNCQLAFGLASVAPVWLLVDGAEAAAHPAGDPYDKWTVGKPVRLSAGLHQLEALTVCRDEIDTGVAWKRPGASTLASEVAMVSGAPLRTGRWERRDRSVQPFAFAKYGEAYRFAGTDELFVPCTFHDRSASWGGKATLRWTLNGKPLGGAEELPLILPASKLPCSVELKVASPALGEERSFTLPLAWDGPVWSEYAVSTRMADVPAICDADDRLHPMVRMRTSAPDGMGFEIASTIRFRGGAVSNRISRVTTNQGWASIYADSFAASDVAELDWSLIHAGISLSKGRARFLLEPYSVLPDAISGEALKAGGDYIVLVTSRAAAKPSAAEAQPGAGDASRKPQSGKGRPFFFDEGLGLSAPIAARDSHTGIGALLPFTVVSNALDVSEFVYAPVFRLADLADPSGFERRVSAMTGLLSSPAAGSRRVLLVVPPEPDVLPDCGCAPAAKPCIHAQRAREFAQAVIRVADVHGFATADLFTAFETVSGSAPLMKNGCLTEAGKALAIAIINEKCAAR